MRKTGTESPSGLALDLGHVNAWMQASRASTRAAEILPPAIALGATFYNLFVAARPAPLGTAELALNVVVICALALTMTLIAITGFSRQIVTWSATLAISVVFIFGSVFINCVEGGDPLRVMLWLPWLMLVYVQNAGVFRPLVALAISGTIFLASLSVPIVYLGWGDLRFGALHIDVVVIISLLQMSLIGMLFNVARRREAHLLSRVRAEQALATEQERARVAAELANARLERARSDRSLTASALAVSVAHEIRQPLASIIASSQASRNWLLRERPDISEALSCSDRILQDALRASDIVVSMRDLLRRRPTERQLIDASSIVANLEPTLRAVADAHEAQLIVETVTPLPLVSIDAGQIGQVIVNLVENAMEASAVNPPGSRPVRLAIQPAGDGIEILVEDAGHGFSSGPAERLFDAFYSEKPGGMGLGLAICQTIIDAHGGQIRAQSLSRGPGSASSSHPGDPPRRSGLGRLLHSAAQPLGHTHEVGNRERPHLPHNAPPMHLHGHLAEIERCGDLLVHLAGDDHFHDLALAGRKPRIGRPQRRQPVILGAPQAISIQRQRDGVQQVLFPKRLGEELDGARFHGRHRDGHIGMG